MFAARTVLLLLLAAAMLTSACVAPLPLAVPGFLLLLPAYGISEALKQPSARDELARGDAARARRSLNEAADAYLLAAWKGELQGLEKAAQVWLEQGRIADALRARLQLVCSGGLSDEAEWSHLEAWLREQGHPVPECADPSIDSIEIPWRE